MPISAPVNRVKKRKHGANPPPHKRHLPTNAAVAKRTPNSKGYPTFQYYTPIRKGAFLLFLSLFVAKVGIRGPFLEVGNIAIKEEGEG